MLNIFKSASWLFCQVMAEDGSEERMLGVFLNLPLHTLYHFFSPWPVPSHAHASGSSSGWPGCLWWDELRVHPRPFLRLLLPPSCQSNLSRPVHVHQMSDHPPTLWSDLWWVLHQMHSFTSRLHYYIEISLDDKYRYDKTVFYFPRLICIEQTASSSLVANAVFGKPRFWLSHLETLAGKKQNINISPTIKQSN